MNAKKQMSEKDEELKELKSERNNTRVSDIHIYTTSSDARTCRFVQAFTKYTHACSACLVNFYTFCVIYASCVCVVLANFLHCHKSCLQLMCYTHHYMYSMHLITAANVTHIKMPHTVNEWPVYYYHTYIVRWFCEF